ncbi:Complex component RRP43 [Oopsacas minuta]|uniref:Ribosomal RNA-processing protein 43 n=1 Tax=Oopsacas minuta TaxID=111878 RepID=A0AAV7JEX7_9METZ|nr:Complex component RRP43 [Oopsacas minuta]
MAENFLSCQPDEYYQRFLDHEIRPDGRKLNEYRYLNIGIGSISTADGSAVLKIGKTTVICGVRAQLTNPPILKPNHGYLVINVDIPGISKGLTKYTNDDEAYTISQIIQEMVSNSKMLDLKSLGIEHKKLSWVLFCDIIICNNDGNALDACLLALVGALKNTRLPHVTVDEDEDIPIVNSVTKHELVLREIPVCVTAAMFRENYVIIDPNTEEEKLSSGSIIVCSLEKGGISYMSSVGAGLEGERKVEMFERAKFHSERIRKELVTACEEQAQSMEY